MTSQHASGTYEGWTNKATWAVNLYVNNDQPIYKRMLANRPFTPETAKAFCLSIFGPKTPDGYKLSNVNWIEIAEDFNLD